MLHQLLIVLFCLHTINFVNTELISSNSSACILNGGGNRVYGITNCISGEVNLVGKYLILGIHNSGSLGTSSSYSSSYYSGSLSVLADCDKTGFDNSNKPSYAGDYFTPGAPIEGYFSDFTSAFLFKS